MNIQIATNPHQSARLLMYGVNPDTADRLLYGNVLSDQTRGSGEIPDYAIPSWSLSALLALLPAVIRKDIITFFLTFGTCSDEEGCNYWEVSYFNNQVGSGSVLYCCEAPDPIEACIRMVKILIDGGHTLNTK